MRRFEFLVNEVRENTDTENINSIGIYEIMRYFNDAQKLIQKIIFTGNSSSDIFVKQAQYEVNSTTTTFELPYDIYAHNAITMVSGVKDGRISLPLTRVAYREKQTLWGYALLDNNIILTTSPQVLTIQTLLVNYTYKLPLLSYRLGQVSAVDTVGNTVTVSGSTIIGDTAFTDRYENFSIVDRNGVQTANQLYLNSFLGLTFSFDGDISTVNVGDWIVCGETGTSHSSLPDAAEPFLMMYVQRRILNKITSSEAASEQIFTTEERNDIEDLFKDTVKDALYPVSADTYYLGY